mgnify:CR=1 FL=1
MTTKLCATEPQPKRRNRTKPPAEVVCDKCGLYGLCLLAGLEQPGSELLDRVVARRQPVSRGDFLFEAGERFRGIFAVKSGSFKASTKPNGHGEKVVDFHFGGELLGLEGIESGQYAHSVRALENSSVCALDFSHVPFTGQQLVDFQQELIRTMSDKILHDQRLSALLGTRSAEQRVAAFLVYVSVRYSEHGLPGIEFRLPMSRDEIAEYLGLALETVSRMFKRFQSHGLLVARGRHTQLLDLPALKEIAGLESSEGIGTSSVQ